MCSPLAQPIIISIRLITPTVPCQRWVGGWREVVYLLSINTSVWKNIGLFLTSLTYVSLSLSFEVATMNSLQ